MKATAGDPHQQARGTSRKASRIEQVRTFVHSYVSLRGNQDLADRIALVVHELLENAVKHGAMMREIELDVRLAATGPDSEVRVSNSVVASRRALLTGEIKRLGTMSAAEAYVDALHRTKKRSQGSCGLGLSRNPMRGLDRAHAGHRERQLRHGRRSLHALDSAPLFLGRLERDLRIGVAGALKALAALTLAPELGSLVSFGLTNVGDVALPLSFVSSVLLVLTAKRRGPLLALLVLAHSVYLVSRETFVVTSIELGVSAEVLGLVLMGAMLLHWAVLAAVFVGHARARPDDGAPATGPYRTVEPRAPQEEDDDAWAPRIVLRALVGWSCAIGVGPAAAPPRGGPGRRVARAGPSPQARTGRRETHTLWRGQRSPERPALEDRRKERPIVRHLRQSGRVTPRSH